MVRYNENNLKMQVAHYNSEWTHFNVLVQFRRLAYEVMHVFNYDLEVHDFLVLLKALVVDQARV